MVARSATLTATGKAKAGARVARDARLRLPRMASAVDAARVTANTVAKPAGSGADMATLATIWPQLSDDPLRVQADYFAALQRGGALSMDAIEALPGTF